MTIARALWQRVHEPRVARTLWALVYLLIAVGGVTAVASPPQSIAGTIGYNLTYTWGGLLVVAGTIGIPAVLAGRWWAERMALKAATGGCLIYALVIIQMHLAASAGNRLPQLLVVSALAVAFAAKLWEIRGLDYEPRPPRG